MDFRDIERALFQMGRLSPHDATRRFPKLSEKLGELVPPRPPGAIPRPNPSHIAKATFELLRDLREEHLVPELVKEMRELIAFENPIRVLEGGNNGQGGHAG